MASAPTGSTRGAAASATSWASRLQAPGISCSGPVVPRGFTIAVAAFSAIRGDGTSPWSQRPEASFNMPFGESGRLLASNGRSAPIRHVGGTTVTFTFEMYDGDGAKVGDYKTSVPGPWNVGELLYDEGRAAWKITSIITADDYIDDDVAGCWLVEPV